MRTRTTTSVALLFYLAALAVDVWLVFVLPEGSWQDHVGLLLGVIGIFAFAIGFLNATELAKELPPYVLDSLTSPDLFKFLFANLSLLGASTDFATAFLYGRDPWTRVAIEWQRFVLFPLWLIYTIAVFSLSLLWFAAAFAYLIFVVPFAYLAYALVSLPLLRISETDEKKAKPPINPWGLKPREVVECHMFQLRVFGVGALATFGAIVVKVISLY